MHPQSDRNLLFGVLAVQMNFVSRDDLVAGIQSWVSDKARPLGEILQAQGKLTAEQVAALEIVIAQHLKAHDNDAERGLRALAGASTVASAITPIDDADVRAILAKLDDETASYQSPTTEARYRRVQFHREGGQGQIFLADDTELHRRVALKEIKPKYADDAASRQRFRLEAEITGNLQHPGIVPVYGLGMYADGRPYYAMRFISDERLTDAIADYHSAAGLARSPTERSVRFRQLLRRFIDVCNTIAYAHDRGVIHRDLKPGNVMLGKFGETLVIDWGMVKTGVEPRPAESVADEAPVQPTFDDDLDATRPGEIKGTFRYMSPEQADGRVDLVGKASDIYSLGATLYEVLAGRPAFSASTREKEKADAEIRVKVLKGEFNPPIESNPAAPPALDAICRKAMALKPSARYATALALAADIEHWLADEPVSAHAEPWTAQAGRWARRHQKTVAGTIAALVVTLVTAVIGAAAVAAEQQKTARQKGIAENNYREARAQLFNSVELIQSSDIAFASDPALNPRRREILKSAAQACRKFLDQEKADTDLRQGAALVFRFKANVHRVSDETADAEPLYLDSIRFYEELTGSDAAADVYRQKLAETLRDYSLWQAKVGQLREAKKSLDRSHDLVTELSKKDASRPAYRQIQAIVLMKLSTIETALGEDADMCRQRAVAAVGIFEDMAKLPAGRGHPYNQLLRADAMNTQALRERERGDIKKANELHKAAMKLVKDLLDVRATQIAPADMFSAEALIMLDYCDTALRGAEPKLKPIENSLVANAKQWRLLATNYPWIPHYRAGEAAARHIHGRLCLDTKRAEHAAVHFDASRLLLEPLVKAYPDVVEYRADLGKTCAGLALAARARGDNEAADQWRQKARETLTEAVSRSAHDARLRTELRALDK